MLKDKITNIINFAHTVAVNGAKDDEVDFVERFIAEKEINQMIENDFMERNPDDMIDEYVDYVKTLDLNSKKINKGCTYYRARIGCEMLSGSVDDYNRNFMIPYYGRDICAPPPLLSAGGRFNNEGTSYLYLSDNINTCIAEVHAQINQICSIGEFVATSDFELIDLRESRDLEASIIIKLLTQPVNNNNRNRYNMTRFLSRLLRIINPNGIIFESVQSAGNNIVCFNKKLFMPVEYSQVLYKVKKINYETEKIKGAVEEYAERARHSYGSILSINEDDEKNREEKFEYLEEWIEHERKILSKK